MPRIDPFARLRNVSVLKEKDVCCGEKMIILDKFMHCIICNTLVSYIPAMFQKPQSQKTGCDSEGNIHYGQSVERTPDERISGIVGEFKQKMGMMQIDSETLYKASRLMYEITKKYTKKKDNRNQLFAACLFLIAAESGYAITVPDLVANLKLEKDGIKTGIGYVKKYVIVNQLGVTLDPPLQRPFIVKYLRNAASLNPDSFANPDIVTDANIGYCERLVNFMLDMSIAFDTIITSKCSASVYYLLLIKEKNYIGKKKDLSVAIGVGQNTSIKIVNILCTPEVQKIIPKEFAWTRLKYF